MIALPEELPAAGQAVSSVKKTQPSHDQFGTFIVAAKGGS